jgi:hypothetical protein
LAFSAPKIHRTKEMPLPADIRSVDSIAFEFPHIARIRASAVRISKSKLLKVACLPK